MNSRRRVFTWARGLFRRQVALQHANHPQPRRAQLIVETLERRELLAASLNATILIPSPPTGGSPALFDDFLGAGRPQLLVMGSSTSKLYQTNASGLFAEVGSIPFGGTATAAASGDINGDGKR